MCSLQTICSFRLQIFVVWNQSYQLLYFKTKAVKFVNTTITTTITKSKTEAAMFPPFLIINIILLVLITKITTNNSASIELSLPFINITILVSIVTTTTIVTKITIAKIVNNSALLTLSLKVHIYYHHSFLEGAQKDYLKQLKHFKSSRGFFACKYSNNHLNNNSGNNRLMKTVIKD